MATGLQRSFYNALQISPAPLEWISNPLALVAAVRDALVGVPVVGFRQGFVKAVVEVAIM